MEPVHAHHDGSEVYLQEQARSLRLFLRTRGPVERAYVRTIPDGEEYMTRMERVNANWWGAEVGLDADVLTYRFMVVTPEGNWYVTGCGLTRSIPTDQNDFRFLRRSQLPKWLEQATFYQIFPDRFRRGPDPTLRVRSGEVDVNGALSVAREWDEPPRRETVETEFYGGDLAGIVDSLDYLQSMGFNALYLNPIFRALTNHRYDVLDYGAVDPHLGGNNALANLTRALHERGMRVILDFVPNHCSWRHPWFLEALRDPDANDFFFFEQHPEKYRGWLGFRHLPKLNYHSDRLRREVGAYLRKWLLPPYSVDGYRLDVVNTLGKAGGLNRSHEIVQNFRQVIKGENPDAYLVGEHMLDGTPYLQGHELDACMNYRGFAMPMLHWLAGCDLGSLQGHEFGDRVPLTGMDMVKQWRSFMAAIPWQVARSQLNLLTSHDVPRLRSLLHGDDGLIEVALTLLYTYPGVPCLYYGEEIGLVGDRDPFNRGPMPWDVDLWHEPTRRQVRLLTRLRHDLPALRRGGLEVLWVDYHRVVFRRLALDQSLVIDVSRRAGPEIEPAVGRLRDVVGGAEHRGRLPARTGPGGNIYLEDQLETERLFPF